MVKGNQWCRAIGGIGAGNQWFSTIDGLGQLVVRAIDSLGQSVVCGE